MNDDERPAFPGTWTNQWDGLATAPNGEVVPPGGSVVLPGMSLRDYFAAKAMAAMVMNPDNNGDVSDFAIWAYRYADAMLKERAK